MGRSNLWIFAAIFLGLAALSAAQNGEFEDPPEPGRVVFTDPRLRNAYWLVLFVFLIVSFFKAETF